MTNIKAQALLICMGAILLVSVALHFFAFPRIYDMRLVVAPSNKEIPVILPVVKGDTPSTLLLKINYHYPQQTKVQVIAQGCIKKILLNNHNIPFIQQESCDPRMHEYTDDFWRNKEKQAGMIIDLDRSLREGENDLRIEAKYPGLLHVWPIITDTNSYWYLRTILITLTCASIILFMQGLMGEWASGCVLSVGFLVFINQFSHTTFMQYTTDMPGHLDYIAYVAKNWQVPEPHGGWQFYHAPLYYCLQALILAFGNWLGSFDPISLLRLFSLACFMAFLIFGALTLRLLIRNDWCYYVALIFLVFYPSGIIISSRLDSHLLFYTLYSGVIYFTLRWIYEENDRYLGMALGMFGLCLATRTNSYLLIPIILIALLYKWRTRGFLAAHFRAIPVMIGVLTFISGLIVNMGRSYYYNVDTIGNISMLSRDELLITNSVKTLLLFNVTTYLNKPFWDIWHDGTGRNYFWNSLLKSSLFGEFTWNHPEIAYILSVLLLWFIAYQLVNVVIDWKYYLYRREWWILAVLLGWPVLALMRLRLLYPYAGSQDFRYIYPSLIGFCGLTGLIIERHLSEKNYISGILTVISVMAFSCVSALFFLRQYG